MKLGISGKGGVGKTTISGTLARLAAAGGYETLALDCDSNPNLGLSMGFGLEDIAAMSPLPRTVRGDEPEPATRLVAEHGRRGPDGVNLVLAARIDEAAVG